MNMQTDEKRTFKNQLYEQFARLGKALASPHRLELLDVLAQCERTVEALAQETGMSVANASQHLQVLRSARLVETRREGTSIYYRLASESVSMLWLSLRAVGEAHLAEIDRVVEAFLQDLAQWQPITAEALLVGRKGVLWWLIFELVLTNITNHAPSPFSLSFGRFLSSFPLDALFGVLIGAISIQWQAWHAAEAE